MDLETEKNSGKLTLFILCFLYPLVSTGKTHQKLELGNILKFSKKYLQF